MWPYWVVFFVKAANFVHRAARIPHLEHIMQRVFRNFMVEVRDEHLVRSRIHDTEVSCSGLVPRDVVIDAQEKEVDFNVRWNFHRNWRGVVNDYKLYPIE